MRKTTLMIAAGCVLLAFGLLLLFSNTSGRDNAVSSSVSETTLETETSASDSPFTGKELSVSTAPDDDPITSEAETLADESPFTDGEPSTSTALDVFSVTKEEFQQLPEEEQDKMMEAFVDQFWEDELSQSDKPPEQEHRLSLDIFNRPYMQTITEREFWQLSPEDQEKAMAETVESARQTRARARDIIAQARLGAADNDYVRAEAYLLHALETGRELSANKDGMFITRVVGISCEKEALNEMVKLYNRIGDHSRRQIAQEQLSDLENEVEEMRNTAKEFEAR